MWLLQIFWRDSELLVLVQPLHDLQRLEDMSPGEESDSCLQGSTPVWTGPFLGTSLLTVALRECSPWNVHSQGVSEKINTI